MNHSALGLEVLCNKYWGSSDYFWVQA